MIKSRENNELISKYKKLLMEVADLNKIKKENNNKIKIMNKKLNKIQNTIDENNNKYENLIVNNDRANKIKEQFDLYNKDIEEFNIIIQILENNTDGIVQNLLKDKIIPSLENIVNAIFSNIEKSKINIDYLNGEFSIYKDGQTKIMMNGGYFKHILHIIFRVALMQINNYCKTNFIIIDEAFDNCSEEGKQNIIKLIDKIKEYYEYAIIISHDLEIKTEYDQIVKIKQYDNYNKICV
jgi:DNA repair exonuclease SbcCD ATPase subunit